MNDHPDFEPKGPRQAPPTRYSVGQKLTLGAGGFALALVALTHFLPGASTTPQPPPAPQQQHTAAATPQVQHAAAQLAMIDPAHAEAALRHSPFPADQQANILAAVKRGELRLVNMPVFDPQGIPGNIITISSAGLSQRVVLSGKPQQVLLPIQTAGEVDITPVTTPGPTGLAVGAIFAMGPTVLPAFNAPNQMLALDVFVQ